MRLKEADEEICQLFLFVNFLIIRDRTFDNSLILVALKSHVYERFDC